MAEGEKSIRWKMQQERLARVANQKKVRRVRVNPKNDVLRKTLIHPINKIAFPADSGSVEWPYDDFTKRRLRDGDVTLEGEIEQQERHAQRARDRRRGKDEAESTPQS